jgi:hypothetical protein
VAFTVLALAAENLRRNFLELDVKDEVAVRHLLFGGEECATG